MYLIPKYLVISIKMYMIVYEKLKDYNVNFLHELAMK